MEPKELDGGTATGEIFCHILLKFLTLQGTYFGDYSRFTLRSLDERKRNVVAGARSPGFVRNRNRNRGSEFLKYAACVGCTRGCWGLRRLASLGNAHAAKLE